MKRRCPAVDNKGDGSHCLSGVKEVRTAVDNVNRNVSDGLIASGIPLVIEGSKLHDRPKRCKWVSGESILSSTDSRLNVKSNEEEFETPECITEDCHVAEVAGADDVEKRIELAIISLANVRGTQKTFCPSEIPRLVLKFPNWRDYMDLTRSIVFKMATSGIVEVMQKGIVRTTSEFEILRGPMRVRLSP